MSLIPALADAVPQIEGASAGMPFIASPSIFTDGSCDDGRISSPSWFNPFLYIDDESRRRVRVTDRDEIGTSTKKDFMAFRWFAVSFVVSYVGERDELDLLSAVFSRDSPQALEHRLWLEPGGCRGPI